MKHYGPLDNLHPQDSCCLAARVDKIQHKIYPSEWIRQRMIEIARLKVVVLLAQLRAGISKRKEKAVVRKILVKDGLLWSSPYKFPDRDIINCIAGDYIAAANGMIFVERIINKYPDNTMLYLNEDDVIIKAKMRGIK